MCQLPFNHDEMPQLLREKYYQKQAQLQQDYPLL